MSNKLNRTNASIRAAKGITEHIYFDETDVFRAKTVCTSQCLAYLGIDASEYNYSGTMKQMKRIARKLWSVRSVWTRFSGRGHRGITVNQLAREVQEGWEDGTRDGSILCYIVEVDGHVLIMSRDGSITIDTAPRRLYEDFRAVRSINAVREM